MESEKLVLASILSFPDLIKDLVISQDYFIDPMNRFCIKLLIDEYKTYNKVDLVMLGEFYKSEFKKITFSEFITYMTDLMTNTLVSKQNFMLYQEGVIHSYKNNQLRLMINKFSTSQINQDELINEINELDKINLISSNENFNPDEIYNLITSKEGILESRFSGLMKFGNIQKHDTPIISARPGIGKTAFALNLLEDFSKRYKCLYFNLEMSEKQLWSRIVSIHSHIPLDNLINPATEYQGKKVREFVEDLKNNKINIVSGSQTIKTIKARIIKESQEEHLIVFIDYVGLIRGLNNKESIYERVTNIVKELRQISQDYNCTIFIIAQINRNSESNKDKSPKISDLKESGELEQSGTTVLMLHDTSNGNSNDESVPINVIIGKNRNGKTGAIQFIYNKLTQQFVEKKEYVANPNDWRKEE